MIRTGGGALYTGITTDVARRFQQHLSGRGARYLRGHSPTAIVFKKRIGTKSLASKLEYQVKKLDKPRKEAIVASGRLRFRKPSGLLCAPRRAPPRDRHDAV